MCTRLKVGNNNFVTIGSIVQVLVGREHAVRFSRFGIPWGLDILPNLRSEKFNTTWKDYSTRRCIVPVDAFIERGHEFKLEGQKVLLGGLCSNDFTSFALLTKDSEGIIKSYHDREPVVINGKEDYFLETGNPDFSKFHYNLQNHG